MTTPPRLAISRSASVEHTVRWDAADRGGRPDRSPSWLAPAVGLAAFAAAVLVEAVGAFGYDTIADTRNGLATFHDVGLAITPIGMIAAIVGFAVALAVGLGRRGGAAGWLGGAAAIVFLAGGLIFVKVLLGM